MRTINFTITFYLLVLLSSCNESNLESTQQKHKINLLSAATINTVNQPFKHNQPLTSSFKIHEALGSGLVVIDIDNDNQYEVFFAQFEKNHSASILYKWQNGQFKDITETAGLAGLTALMGATVADINNDGWDDLLLYGYKQIHLMLNENGYFKEVQLPQLPNNSFYSSATFFNADKDEFLDLWLSRYVDASTEKSCKGNDGLRMYCAPSAYTYQSDILLLNNQGLSFEQAPKSMINIPASPSLGVVSADFNNDRLQDIFVANDGENNNLFMQLSDGSFIEQAEIKSVGSNLAGLKEASMGVAIGDFDNDGLQDLFLTHLDQETNTLYHNEKDWFVDVTNPLGLGYLSRNQTGFGTGFYDLNGDNWLDLMVANGRIQPKPYQSRENLTQQFKEKPLLFLNMKDKFITKEIFQDFKIVARGLAFVDIDNDGDLDILSNNNNQSPTIFNNNLNPEDWFGLKVKCYGRTDMGAKINVTISNGNTQQNFYRVVHTDGSYASASDSRILFYLKTNDILKSAQIEFTNQTKKEITKQLIKNQYITVDC